MHRIAYFLDIVLLVSFKLFTPSSNSFTDSSQTLLYEVETYHNEFLFARLLLLSLSILSFFKDRL